MSFITNIRILRVLRVQREMTNLKGEVNFLYLGGYKDTTPEKFSMLCFKNHLEQL